MGLTPLKMKVHKLKIQEEYLEELKAGNKTCEIRLNDRDYQKGDILEFSDYSHYVGLTGNHPRRLHFEITHIHSGLGMEKNYVVLSIKRST